MSSSVQPRKIRPRIGNESEQFTFFASSQWCNVTQWTPARAAASLVEYSFTFHL